MSRVIPESRLHERRRRRRNVRIGVLCALVVLFFTGLVLISRASFLRITQVDVSGASSELAPKVEALALGHLSGAYGHLFARSDILLYPKGAISTDVLVQFPEVKSVAVRADTLHAISIAIVERVPVALWCADSSASAALTVAATSTASASAFAGSNCFLLDENGLAYAPASGGEGESGYKKYFGATVGDMLPKQYLTPEQFHTLFAFVAAAEQKAGGDTAARVFVDDAGDAHVFFASGFELRFSMADNAGGVLQRFALAQTSSIFKAHSLKDFLYLDLRFGDKIYYKLKTK